MIILLQIYKTFPIFIEINREMWLFYIKIDVIVNNSPCIFIESFKFTSKYFYIRLSTQRLLALSGLIASYISPTYKQVPSPYVLKNDTLVPLSFGYSYCQPCGIEHGSRSARPCRFAQQRTWHSIHVGFCRMSPHGMARQRFVP